MGTDLVNRTHDPRDTPTGMRGICLLPVGSQATQSNGLKHRMEVGLDPGTNIGCVFLHAPLGGCASKKT